MKTALIIKSIYNNVPGVEEHHYDIDLIIKAIFTP